MTCPEHERDWAEMQRHMSDLRVDVRCIRSDMAADRKEVLQAIEKLAASVHKTREQMALEVGRRQGATAKWVRPAAVGTGWATLAAGIVLTALKLLGAPVPATLPVAQSGQQP